MQNAILHSSHDALFRAVLEKFHTVEDLCRLLLDSLQGFHQGYCALKGPGETIYPFLKKSL